MGASLVKFQESLKGPDGNELDLVGKSVTRQELKHLRKFLETDSRVHVMKLSFNNLRGLGSLVSPLCTPMLHITVMLLQHCQIDDDVCAQIASRMTRSEIEQLDLSSNEISDRGVTQLAEHLETADKLRVLRLRANQCADAGAEALAMWLRANGSLLILDLAENQVGSAGGFVLGNMLSTNVSLRELDLSNNVIRPRGGFALLELSDKNQVLQKLEVTGNPIDPPTIISTIANEMRRRAQLRADTEAAARSPAMQAQPSPALSPAVAAAAAAAAAAVPPTISTSGPPTPLARPSPSPQLMLHPPSPGHSPSHHSDSSPHSSASSPTNPMRSVATAPAAVLGTAAAPVTSLVAGAAHREYRASVRSGATTTTRSISSVGSMDALGADAQAIFDGDQAISPQLVAAVRAAGHARASSPPRQSQSARARAPSALSFSGHAERALGSQSPSTPNAPTLRVRANSVVSAEPAAFTTPDGLLAVPPSRRRNAGASAPSSPSGTPTRRLRTHSGDSGTSRTPTLMGHGLVNIASPDMLIAELREKLKQPGRDPREVLLEAVKMIHSAQRPATVAAAAAAAAAVSPARAMRRSARSDGALGASPLARSFEYGSPADAYADDEADADGGDDDDDDRRPSIADLMMRTFGTPYVDVVLNAIAGNDGDDDDDDDDDDESGGGGGGGGSAAARDDDDDMDDDEKSLTDSDTESDGETPSRGLGSAISYRYEYEDGQGTDRDYVDALASPHGPAPTPLQTTDVSSARTHVSAVSMPRSLVSSARSMMSSARSMMSSARSMTSARSSSARSLSSAGAPGAEGAAAHAFSASAYSTLGTPVAVAPSGGDRTSASSINLLLRRSPSEAPASNSSDSDGAEEQYVFDPMPARPSHRLHELPSSRASSEALVATGALPPRPVRSSSRGSIG